MSSPTSEEISQMLRVGTGEQLVQFARFPTGLCHIVFDVLAQSGKRFVVRVASDGNERRVDGSIYWATLLRPIGIPLPEIHYRGVLAHRHFTVLERLPGTDLGNVFVDLTAVERRAIASAVVGLQNRMHDLPIGGGYGYATSYEGPYTSPSWAKFIEVMLGRSAKRCQTGGIVDPKWVSRVRAHAQKFAPYFASIEPWPFLDDLTTKNVLVSGHKMTGAVDVDEVCFGDRLLHVGLMRMAILDQGWDEDYISELCNYEGFGLVERQSLDFYTALYCVDFLSELGHAFNRDSPPTDSAKIFERRIRILEALLVELAKIDRVG